MIQRVQTIYLALATIFTAFFAFANLATIATTDSIYQLTTFGLFDASHKEALPVINTLWFGLFSWLLVGLQIVIIFLYKTRVQQIRLTIISIVVNIGFMGLVYFVCSKSETLLSAIVSYNITAIFPLISTVFLVLALLGIKKDENLIKSLNRIR